MNYFEGCFKVSKYLIYSPDIIFLINFDQSMYDPSVSESIICFMSQCVTYLSE